MHCRVVGCDCCSGDGTRNEENGRTQRIINERKFIQEMGRPWQKLIIGLCKMHKWVVVCRDANFIVISSAQHPPTHPFEVLL